MAIDYTRDDTYYNDSEESFLEYLKNDYDYKDEKDWAVFALHKKFPEFERKDWDFDEVEIVDEGYTCLNPSIALNFYAVNKADKYISAKVFYKLVRSKYGNNFDLELDNIQKVSIDK